MLDEAKALLAELQRRMVETRRSRRCVKVSPDRPEMEKKLELRSVPRGGFSPGEQ